MDNQFLTQDVARGYFWEAIRKVCPEAFDDLAGLVEHYRDHLLSRAEQGAFDDEWTLDQIKDVVCVDHAYIDETPLVDWLRRWNLLGESGMEPVHQWLAWQAINCLAIWVNDPRDLASKRLFVTTMTPSIPIFQIPELVIEEAEPWNKFTKRAEKTFTKTLKRYKNAIKDIGYLKQDLRRDARWLVAFQVKSLSWKKVADSEELNPGSPEPFGYDSIRKATTNFARILPLKLRK